MTIRTYYTFSVITFIIIDMFLFLFLNLFGAIHNFRKLYNFWPPTKISIYLNIRVIITPNGKTDIRCYPCVFVYGLYACENINKNYGMAPYWCLFLM